MVDKYLKPHSSILEAIASKSPNATPFSAIPLFLKKYIVQAENAREISTILQKISEKEIDHLEKKLSVHNLNISFDVYKNIIEKESGIDSK